MSVTVILYNTPSDAFHVVKDISTVIGTYSGDVRGAVSVDRPVIEIQDTVTTGNYCYIDAFGRFYWIAERTVLRTGLTQLVLRSDPAYTAWNSGQLQTLPFYCTRTDQVSKESNGSCGYNAYIPDRMVQKTARTYSIVKIDPNVPKFAYPDSALDTDRQFILGVIG